MNGKLKMTMRLEKLDSLQRKSPKDFKQAAKKGAIQFLTWSNNGSKNEPKKPPIRWGVLRGSSSAFVGKELVQIFPMNIKSGAPEAISPAKSYSGKPLNMTWVWNTDYATMMHEFKVPPGKWGKFTLQDGSGGSKWLEKHLKKDKDDLMKMIAKEFKKAAGL